MSRAFYAYPCLFLWLRCSAPMDGAPPWRSVSMIAFLLLACNVASTIYCSPELSTMVHSPLLAITFKPSIGYESMGLINSLKVHVHLARNEIYGSRNYGLLCCNHRCLTLANVTLDVTYDISQSPRTSFQKLVRRDHVVEREAHHTTVFAVASTETPKP